MKQPRVGFFFVIVVSIQHPTEQSWSVSGLPYFMWFRVIISRFRPAGDCSFYGDMPSFLWGTLVPSSVEFPIEVF